MTDREETTTMMGGINIMTIDTTIEDTTIGVTTIEILTIEMTRMTTIEGITKNKKCEWRYLSNDTG